jgi:hypothetical protein
LNIFSESLEEAVRRFYWKKIRRRSWMAKAMERVASFFGYGLGGRKMWVIARPEGLGFTS